MHIYFAGDHAGFELKKELMECVEGIGHEVEDMGPLALNPGDDFPDFVVPLARKVAESTPPQSSPLKRGGGREVEKGAPFGEKGAPFSEVRGIVVAGSGQGEIIAMNRIRGARAALFCPCNLELIKASRAHNDSNIFALGARFCTVEEAKKGITVWLETPFSGEERHVRRLQKIEELIGH